MAIEIVSFPINSMVIFYSYVSLPEGKSVGMMTFIPKYIWKFIIVQMVNWHI